MHSQHIDNDNTFFDAVSHYSSSGTRRNRRSSSRSSTSSTQSQSIDQQSINNTSLRQTATLRHQSLQDQLLQAQLEEQKARTAQIEAETEKTRLENQARQRQLIRDGLQMH